MLPIGGGRARHRPDGPTDLLKLRSIGQNDYRVLEGRQRIGRIRFASERTPGIWLWNVQVHLTGGLPMGSSKDIDTAASLALASWPIAVAIRAKHCAQLDHGPIRIYRQTAFGRSFCLRCWRHAGKHGDSDKMA